jgi:hypothetical protein
LLRKGHKKERCPRPQKGFETFYRGLVGFEGLVGITIYDLNKAQKGFEAFFEY